MKRKQKKARTKAIKQRQKEARRARVAEADAPALSDVEGPAAPDVEMAVAVMEDPAEIAEASMVAAKEAVALTCREPSRTACREPGRTVDQPTLTETSGPALGDDDLSDTEARGMLARAAKFLNDVVEVTNKALKDVAPKRLAEAFEIATAKPERGQGVAQKRPRRGTDPLVTVIKVGLDAVKVLQRVLARTNPKLGRIKTA